MLNSQASRKTMIGGLLGAIVAYCAANLVFWFFSIGLSPLDVLINYLLRLSLAPIVLGVSSGMLCRVIPGSRSNASFWLSFVATLLAFPITFVVGAALTDMTFASNPVGSTVFYTSLFFGIGIVLELMLLGVWWLFKKAAAESN